MERIEAIRARHSVRQYTEEPIAGETLAALTQVIEQCNKEGGLHIQLILNEPAAFGGMLAKMVRFAGVRNYVALGGIKAADLDEKCGYYGERIVLEAQRLGLNTCWVGDPLRRGKAAVEMPEGEKLALLITIGYGKTQGVAHKSKPLESFYTAEEPLPEWFRAGVEAARLAPTAINQQKFHFALDGNTVTATTANGPLAAVDVGIAKYHFEIGAGDADWRWA
jgi:nitroreductase